MQSLIGVLAQDAQGWCDGWLVPLPADDGSLGPAGLCRVGTPVGASAPSGITTGRSASAGTHAVVWGLAARGATSAAELADLYEAGGVRALADVVGPFAAALLQPERARAVLVRSASGQCPLYLVDPAATQGALLFADRANALIAHPRLPDTLDEGALLDYAAHGVVWGERTLHPGVRLLRPGTYLELAAGETPGPARDFVSWPRGDEVGDVEEARRDIHQALGTSLSRVLEADAGATICLSAGLDSRCLLALASELGHRPRCITNGLTGSIELELTARMCQRLGLEHLQCLMGGELVDSLGELTATVAEASDGEADVMNVMMLHVGRRYRDEFGLGQVIRGHGGELMKLSDAYGFALDEALATGTDHAAACERILAQISGRVRDQDARAALAPHLADAWSTAPPASFRGSYERHAAGSASAGQAASRVFLTEYNGRHTMNAMRCLARSVDVALPFLSEDVVMATLRSPIGLRGGTALQTSLIRAACPELLAIPSSALRVPLTAGPWRRRLAALAARVRRRLGAGGGDAPEGWLIGELSGLFSATLLDDDALARPHVNADGLRALVRRSSAGDRSVNALLGRLLLVELHLRGRAA